jgi:DNA polymerase III delta prime subunit
MKICLSGPSGSGKTYSALQLARGLSGSWERICVIDTEQGSASLYSVLGSFNVISMDAPYHPKRYIEALELATTSGMSVVIIDSISHEWAGKGGCLELHEQTLQRMKVPNSFTAWASVTPLHQEFLDAITQSKLHVICTARSKTEYVLVDRNGKQTPQKVGMSPITRDGFEFEMSIHFELDQMHQSFCSKDRTSLFMDKPPFIITKEVGEKILHWCNGDDDNWEQLILASETIATLKTLHDQMDAARQQEFLPLLRFKKAEILAKNHSAKELAQRKTPSNGTVDIL